MPKHPPTTQLQSFGGINNVLRPERTDPKFLKEAVNVDIDKSGGIQKRLGYEAVDSGVYHSVWSDGTDAFAVKNNSIVRITKDLTVVDLSYPIHNKVAFEKINGVVYFVSEGATGMIVGNTVYPWGIEEPNPKPLLSSTTGGLTSGVYQVAITYVRSTGEESGTGLAQTITVSGPGGILVSNIPTSSDPLVVSIRIYVSTPDGEILYALKDVSNGTTSTVIASVDTAMLPLPSFNRKTPPRGHILRYYNGRAIIADNDLLWLSDPYSVNWFDLQKNYLPFPARIRAVMPVASGIWIAADHLYYLRGEDIDTMTLEMKEPILAVEGTDVMVPGAYIFIDNTPIGYKWLISSNKGIYICFNDGVALNMTERNYTMPQADEGAAEFVQKDGINRYMSILNKKKDSDNAAVGDQVTAEIIRNGVRLED